MNGGVGSGGRREVRRETGAGGGKTRGWIKFMREE